MSQSEVMSVIKLELEPCDDAVDVMDGQSRICNWIYNKFLDDVQVLYQQYVETKDPELAKIIYSERGLRDLLPQLKEENPFLKVVHSSVSKNAVLRLSQAIQAHQKSKKGKRKGKVGWPKFRSWKRKWFSLYYDEPNKGFKIEGDQLILSLGMGEDKKRRSISIPIKDAHLLKNKEIRNLRIVKYQGRFSAVFTVRTIVPAKKEILRVVALDPNHKNLCYGVDTEGCAFEIESPYWLKIHDKVIDELKSKRDRCQKKSKQFEVLDSNNKPTGKTYYKPSRRWEKYNKMLENAYQKRREQTKTFLFTVAHQLIAKYDCIGIGDYTPHGGGITTKMRRAMNNQSLNNRFKETLSWLAIKSGKTFLEYNEKGTTRTCSCCPYINKEGISPEIRIWTCPQCKIIHIRDENAAANGLREVLRNLAKESEKFSQVSCSDHALVKERCAWRVMPSGVVRIPRGHDSNLLQRQEIKQKT